MRFQQSLPNANLVLTLSILSLVTCCCFGITGFVLALIALIIANRDMKLYYDDPQRYLPGSFSNLSTGRILAIVSLVLNSGMLVLMILRIFFAIMFPFAFMNEVMNNVEW
jgi:hypothetical protein